MVARRSFFQVIKKILELLSRRQWLCKKPVLISKDLNIWREIYAGGGGIVFDLKERNILKMALLSLISFSQEELNNLKPNKLFLM